LPRITTSVPGGPEVGYRVTGTATADTGNAGIIIAKLAIIIASKIANDLLNGISLLLYFIRAFFQKHSGNHKTMVSCS
jgi:hypothetical protein